MSASRELLMSHLRRVDPGCEDSWEEGVRSVLYKLTDREVQRLQRGIDRDNADRPEKGTR